jgi:hypothetical protein
MRISSLGASFFKSHWILAAAAAPVAFLAVNAQAANDGIDHQGLVAKQLVSWKLGTPMPAIPGGRAPSPDVHYDNGQNFEGFIGFNQGAGPDPANAANTITKMLIDDIDPSQADAGAGAIVGDGGVVDEFQFGFGNANAAPITVRPRVRFYQNNGGVPGTLITGFTFNPITVNANSANGFFTTLPAGSQFTIPNGKFWAGITFDNNGGTTGATVADMSNVGGLLFDPPAVGFSDDIDFQTSSQGAFLVNNPPGAVRVSPYAPDAIASYLWEFSGPLANTPEPAAIGLLAGAAFGLTSRRRK